MIGINYPFTLDGFGRIETVSNSNKIYLDRIMTLISTINGQRPMRPTYGTDVGRGMLESGMDYTSGVLQAIRTAMAIWLPMITIDDLTITKPGPDGVATVNLSVTFPDLTQDTVKVTTAYLAQNGTIVGDN